VMARRKQNVGSNPPRRLHGETRSQRRSQQLVSAKQSRHRSAQLHTPYCCHADTTANLLQHTAESNHHLTSDFSIFLNERTLTASYVVAHRPSMGVNSLILAVQEDPADVTSSSNSAALSGV
jgi:hypothetical protein